MSRILVIAPQFVGDSILAVAFLRELKKHVGRIEIDVISKNAGCLVFKNCPYISNIYDINSLNISLMRKNAYTKAYILKRSLSAAILAWRLGIKDTIGFGGQFREIFIKKVVKYDKTELKHELEHFMDVLRADYIEINSTKLEYYTQKSALERIKNCLSEKKKVIFVPCSSTPVKNWNIKKFAQVLDFMNENNYEVYFAGLEKEKAYCDEIILGSKTKHAKNLCGSLSFDEVIALISSMDLVFGVDSGFCHVASAFGKKVVVLFGATSISQWKPVNSTVISVQKCCSPCLSPKKCKQNYACMQEISVEKVISVLGNIL